MPRVILSHYHLGGMLQQFRLNRGITRRALGARLYVSAKTVQNRELAVSVLNVRDLLATVAIFDYDLVLQKRRRPGARPTGTGWPT